MLVDDEDTLRSMLQAALRHNGFDVVSVATGQAALETVPAPVGTPDLPGPERRGQR